jgi:hypothetical protein
MTRTKIILGMAFAASLASLAPVADAAPIAASRAAVTMSSTNGSLDVIQVSTHPTRRHNRRR